MGRRGPDLQRLLIKSDELGQRRTSTLLVYCDCPRSELIDDDDYVMRGQMRLATPTIDTTACVNTYGAKLTWSDGRHQTLAGAAGVKNWMVCGR